MTDKQVLTKEQDESKHEWRKAQQYEMKNGKTYSHCKHCCEYKWVNSPTTTAEPKGVK